MTCITCHLDYPLHEFPDDAPRVCYDCRNRSGLVLAERDDALEWWVVAAEANGYECPARQFSWVVK